MASSLPLRERLHERCAMKITANIETLETTQAAAGNVYVCHWKQEIDGKVTEGWREWAIFVVHDELGLLSIVSAFGNWSHRWAPRNLGDPTLHHFLARTNADYVMGKLARHETWNEYSFKKTKEALIEELLANRRDGCITKEKARARFDELAQWEEDDGDYVTGNWEWPEWVTDRWERVCETPSPVAEAFKDQIWPVLRKCITDELARRSSVADVVP